MKNKLFLFAFVLSSLFITLGGTRILMSGETTTDIYASATINPTCTISASSMPFSAYAGAAINATSDITVNCTYNTTFTAYINNSPDVSSSYKLIRVTSPVNDGSLPADYLLMTLKKTNTNGAQITGLTSGATTFTGTGSGSGSIIGTIFGTITAGQTARSEGSFNKIFTLNIVY
jgi:spore coat protein U-like protein